MIIRVSSRLASLAVLLHGLAIAPARADFSFNFNNGNDAGLTRNDPLAPFGSGSTFTFPVLGPGNDGYRLTSGPSADPGSLGLPRVGAYVADQTFTNFRASIDIVSWNPSRDQAIGLFARGSNVGLGTTNGYYLHYNNNPSGSFGQLVIDRVDGERPDPGFALVNLTQLDPTAGYRLVFTGSGAMLTGQIFSLGNLSNPLATVTRTDGTYASGNVGLLATGTTLGGNTGVDATYDNFQASAAVPEPSSLALCGMAGFVGLGIARIRRGRSKAA